MEIKDYLQSEGFSSEILQELNMVLRTTIFDYRTFGTEIEKHVCDKVIKMLMTKRLIKSYKEILKAKNKNQFPDITILSPQLLGLEIKSGRRNKHKGQDDYIPVKNSQNDMGTPGKWGEN